MIEYIKEYWDTFVSMDILDCLTMALLNQQVWHKIHVTYEWKMFTLCPLTNGALAADLPLMLVGAVNTLGPWKRNRTVQKRNESESRSCNRIYRLKQTDFDSCYPYLCPRCFSCLTTTFWALNLNSGVVVISVTPDNCFLHLLPEPMVSSCTIATVKTTFFH